MKCTDIFLTLVFGSIAPETPYTCVYPNAKLLPMKDAAIRIRVERELRTSFLEACRTTERQASDVLREFMQAYVERYLGGQGDLFPSRDYA